MSEIGKLGQTCSADLYLQAYPASIEDIPIQVTCEPNIVCPWTANLSCYPTSFSTIDPLEFAFSDEFEFDTKYGIPNSKNERKWFRCFPTVFYFFAFYSEYPVFEVRFILFLAREVQP